jgi:hypothetical protein
MSPSHSLIDSPSTSLVCCQFGFFGSRSSSTSMICNTHRQKGSGFRFGPNSPSMSPSHSLIDSPSTSLVCCQFGFGSRSSSSTSMICNTHRQKGSGFRFGPNSPSTMSPSHSLIDSSTSLVVCCQFGFFGSRSSSTSMICNTQTEGEWIQIRT